MKDFQQAGNNEQTSNKKKKILTECYRIHFIKRDTGKPVKRLLLTLPVRKDF